MIAMLLDWEQQRVVHHSIKCIYLHCLGNTFIIALSLLATRHRFFFPTSSGGVFAIAAGASSSDGAERHSII